MSLDSMNKDEKVKIEQWMTAAIKVKQEIGDLNEGLKEATKSIADELNVKPAILNKALKMAIKANSSEERENLALAEEILQATGRF